MARIKMDFDGALVCLREMESSTILKDHHEDALSFAITALEWMKENGIIIKE